MSSLRRRIVRPAVQEATPASNRQKQLQKLRARLHREQQALARWHCRLRRAFNAVQKHSKQLARIQRQITKLEES